MNSTTRTLTLLAATLSLSVFAYACGPDNDGMEVRPGLLIESATAQSSDACLQASGVLDDTAKKVTICHIPPGNPDNAHTISISRHAFHTHQDHHNDYLGDCGCAVTDTPDAAGTPVDPPAPDSTTPSGTPAPDDGSGAGDQGADDGGTDDGGSSADPATGGSPTDASSSETCADEDACVVHADCPDNNACASGCCIYVML